MKKKTNMHKKKTRGKKSWQLVKSGKWVLCIHPYSDALKKMYS